MKCDNISSCYPHIVLTILIIIGINIFIWFIIYIYIMYDTYKNYSSDLISWKNEQLNQIDNEKYKSKFS